MRQGSVNRSRSALHATGAGLLTLASSEPAEPEGPPSEWPSACASRDRHRCRLLRLQPWADGRGLEGNRAAPAALSLRCAVRARVPRRMKPPGSREVPDQLRSAGSRKTLPGRRFFLRAPLFSTSVGGFLTGRSFSVRAIASEAKFRRRPESRLQDWRGPTAAPCPGAPEDERPAAAPSFAKRAECLHRSAPVACCVRVPVLRNAVSRLPNRHNHDLEKRVVVSDDAVAAGRCLFKPGRA
jgi:hypothetical protein